MDLIDLYLQEDLGEGDITSQALVDDRDGQAVIAAGQAGVLAGLEEAVEVFRGWDAPASPRPPMAMCWWRDRRSWRSGVRSRVCWPANVWPSTS